MELREVRRGDLDGLLALYTELHANPLPEKSAELDALWEGILRDENHHIIVACEDGRIVSSCVLIVVPNLTHGQRPYGLIENVVTAEAYRKRGLATACLNAAREIALTKRCYKLMLLTGSRLDSTLNFYRRAGYNDRDKTAFIQWLD